MPTQAVAAAAEPEQPQMPDAMAMVKQFGMLPVLWGANKIDFTKEDNVITLRVVFATVICIMYLLVQFAVFRVRKANNGARVQNPGGGMYLSDADKGTDGTVSVRVYDNAKLQEAKMQLVMSAAMSLFVHFQWGYTQPLIILSARAICRWHRTLCMCVPILSSLTLSLSALIRHRLHAADADPHQPGDARERARQGGRAAVQERAGKQPARAVGREEKGRGGCGGRKEGRVSGGGERRSEHTTQY